jgi:hypothetical protein
MGGALLGIANPGSGFKRLRGFCSSAEADWLYDLPVNSPRHAVRLQHRENIFQMGREKYFFFCL